MEEDNVLVNDSSYFLPREPKEQQIERKKERAKTLEDQKVLKTLVAHLEARIEFLSSIDAMPDEAKLDPKKFLIMHNAQEIARDHLISEKEFIESLMDGIE